MLRWWAGWGSLFASVGSASTTDAHRSCERTGAARRTAAARRAPRRRYGQPVRALTSTLTYNYCYLPLTLRRLSS